MREIIVILATLTLMLLFGCSGSNNTLEAAIQSKWNAPIKIVLVDETKHAVIFKDNDQYVYNNFAVNNGEFSYSKSGEDGWTFNGGKIPLLLKTIYRSGTGDIIWGAFKTDKRLKKIDVTFVDRKNHESRILICIPITNNAFIGFPQRQFYSSEIEATSRWEVHAKVYDENGNVVLQSTIY